MLARKDFSYFFRTKWLMAVLLSLNLSDMLIVALVYGKLMDFNYFQFFVPAVVIMGLFVAALDTGRRIWLAVREGVIHYYLSLPISTAGIVVAIAATLAALASTHGEFFFAYQQIVQVVLLTLSTVFYPIEVVRQYLPPFLVKIVSVNPLSLAAEAMRQYTFAGSPIEIWSLLFLLLTSTPLAIVGALAYLKALHSIQVKGKL